VIRRGIEIGDLNEGAFDITWAALWGLWDFRAAEPRLPDPEEVARRTALVDYRKVVVDDDAGTVYLPEAGMKIGLGGIAKGYALDRAAEALRARGVDSFLILGGGQVLAGGTRGDRPWKVGVRDPRGTATTYFATLEVTDASTSTSGDYERFFILDGKRYHHIIDPRTGWPSEGLSGVTVVSPDATLADALSTAIMVMGQERGLALAERLPDVEAVLVDPDGDLWTTSGLASRLMIAHRPRASRP
jgi:thiamine biosynthesis lipoprotein